MPAARKQVEFIIKKNDLYLDIQLWKTIQHFLSALNEGWDFIFAVDGPERVGKSTLAISMGYIISKGKLTVKNIVFTADQLKEAIDTFGEGSVIIVDEALMLLLGADYAKEFTKTLIKKLTTIGKKKLIILFVCPYFFMLNKYVAIARTKFLIHLRTKDFLERGDFSLYGYDKKKQLYLRHKDKLYYDPKLVNFSGKVKINKESISKLIDWDSYELKKDDAIESIDAKEDKTIRYRSQRDKLIYNCVKDCQKTKLKACEDLEDVLGMTTRSIFKIYSNVKKKQKL